MKIAVAIDDMLAPASDDWMPATPYIGAAAFLQELTNRGHYIIIHDHRAASVKQANGLWQWCIINGLSFNDVWVLQGKPKVDVFLEPKAPGFVRDYTKLLEKLK